MLTIEALRPGDRVLAAPEHGPDGPVAARRVEAVFRSRSPLVNLWVGGRQIRTTATHPFWVDGRGWTRAGELIGGDRLRSHDGRWVVVGAVEDAGESAAVYNLRVAADHTYFVGARDWGFSAWSHNADCGGDILPNGGAPELIGFSESEAGMIQQSLQNLEEAGYDTSPLRELIRADMPPGYRAMSLDGGAALGAEAFGSQAHLNSALEEELLHAGQRAHGLAGKFCPGTARALEEAVDAARQFPPPK